MKISARLAGVSELARLDLSRLTDRLRTQIERELQATLASDRAHDAQSRRAALDLALTRLGRRLG